MIRIKICGITNIQDAIDAQDCGADALGFIFYKKSKRYITPEDAKKIIGKLNPFIAKVGVFVNESGDKVNRIAKLAGLTHVQLHGNETVAFAKAMQLPVIRAINFNGLSSFNLKEWQEFPILVDSGNSITPGGTGEVFDWHKLSDIIKDIPFILAGGLTPDNVSDAVEITKPVAVDVSSGVELGPGKKSRKKIKLFIDKVKLSESL